ncbi:PE domain-containing protein [Streptomyces sp. NRRL B-1677]|uniref:PE domain-containing protein n=1 Tax=Streptomyces klenkii TaxID=1420899 RepID=A0A3B0BS55_9ACTN|nr:MULTISPECIES: type VII secretion target [Streptomyces]MBF6046786.1 PE domain-containing protein [Streptomyces sp. NRRL B-1677]RKN75271.1 PE domain-containing protein [Streptomyces klenkii]
MDLRVEPGHLEAFARQVGRGAEDMREVLAYARRHTVLPPGADGLYGETHYLHNALRNDVLSAVRRMAEILQSSSEELAAAAGYYRRTDRASAAAFDALAREKGAGQ